MDANSPAPSPIDGSNCTPPRGGGGGAFPITAPGTSRNCCRPFAANTSANLFVRPFSKVLATQRYRQLRSSAKRLVVLDGRQGNSLRGEEFWEGPNRRGDLVLPLANEGQMWYEARCCCFLVDGGCYFLMGCAPATFTTGHAGSRRDLQKAPEVTELKREARKIPAELGAVPQPAGSTPVGPSSSTAGHARRIPAGGSRLLRSIQVECGGLGCIVPGGVAGDS